MVLMTVKILLKGVPFKVGMCRATDNKNNKQWNICYVKGLWQHKMNCKE